MPNTASGSNCHCEQDDHSGNLEPVPCFCTETCTALCHCKWCAWAGADHDDPEWPEYD